MNNTITRTSTPRLVKLIAATPDEVTHALDTMPGRIIDSLLVSIATPCDGYPPFLLLEGRQRGKWCKLVSVEGVAI